MRSRGAKIGVTLLILAVFFIFTRATVQVRSYQLKLELARKNLLNYELSSRLLQKRLRQAMNGNFQEEVRLNVLETEVLNFPADTSLVEPSLNERTGLLLVNLVRLMSFKKAIRINEKKERLWGLQSAFFLERNRRYDLARARYDWLENVFRTEGGDTFAFVLLHGSYCRGITGDFQGAADRLILLRERFPGTHFDESAAALLLVLSERTRRRAEIETVYADARQRARVYYNAGLYFLAAEAFRAILALSSDEKMMYARSLEETGDIERSTEIYRELSTSGDADLQKTAVRRLLLAGNFYGAGTEIRQYASEEAKKLRDEEAIGAMQTTVPLASAVSFEKPEVVEERPEEKEIQRVIEQSPAVTVQSPAASPGQEETQAQTGRTTALAADPSSHPSVPTPEPAAAVNHPVPTPPPVRHRITILLKDGRMLSGFELSLQGFAATINFMGSEITFPAASIARVEGENAGILVTAGGKEISGRSLVRSGGSFQLLDDKNLPGNLEGALTAVRAK